MIIEHVLIVVLQILNGRKFNVFNTLRLRIDFVINIHISGVNVLTFQWDNSMAEVNV